MEDKYIRVKKWLKEVKKVDDTSQFDLKDQGYSRWEYPFDKPKNKELRDLGDVSEDVIMEQIKNAPFYTVQILSDTEAAELYPKNTLYIDKKTNKLSFT